MSRYPGVDDSKLIQVIPGTRKENSTKITPTKFILPRMTNSELLNYLYKHLTVVKDVNYKTEFYFDETGNIVYDHKKKEFSIKYTDSPIPFTATPETIYSLVNKTNQEKNTPRKQEDSVAEILRDLFREIEHGDQEHRSWLKNKIEDFIKQRGYES